MMTLDSETLRLVLEVVIVGVGGYIAKSINDLNIKIAVVISRLSDHDERIKRLENREVH